jgi:hypothetical protein
VKVVWNGKVRNDIIRIDILNNMIDFETQFDSFYLGFDDIKENNIRIIIEGE